MLKDDSQIKSNPLAIINSQCFYRKNQKKLNEIVLNLKKKNADIIMTHYSNHAKKIVKKNETYKEIIAVGGSGMVSEVINGMNLKKQTLGILPVGYTNSLAMELNIKSWKHALTVFEQKKISHIDLIKVTIIDKDDNISIRQIASSCSIGYFNHLRLKQYPVKNIFERIEKKVDLSSIQKPFLVKGRIENGDWNEITLTDIIIGNTSYIQNKYIFKNANLQDDFFHCVFSCVTPIKKIISRLIPNSHIKYGIYKNVKNLDLIFEKPQIVMLDGEIVRNCKRITLEINPEKLYCYANKCGI